MRRFQCTITLLVFLILSVPAQAARPLVLVSTPDMAAIVRAIAGDAVELEVVMAAGADPHTVNVTATQVRSFARAQLAIFAHSETHEFEGVVKSALGRMPSLDWPDYAAAGAVLGDYPGNPQNPHGPWLSLGNARAMAQAIAPRLQALGLPAAALQANLVQFTREVEAQRVAGLRLAEAQQLAGKPLLAVVPGVCDIIANLGLPVGGVLMAEGSGTVSGQQLQEAVSKLRSGAYTGIVCPLSMKQSKQGEAARQVAADSGAPLVYVRFLDTDLGRDTYLSVAAYNAAALAGLTGERTAPAGQKVPLWPIIAVPVALLLGLGMGLKLARPQGPVAGAGIFDASTQDPPH